MTLSTYPVVLFAHILAAMVLVGGSLLAPLLRDALRSAPSVRELRGGLDLFQRSARIHPLAALVLLGTGLRLGRDGWSDFAWFWVAFGGWLVNAGLAVSVVRRAAGALAAATARAGDGRVSAEIDALRRSRAWSLAEDAIRANNLALLFLMVDKPDLTPALAVVALAHLAVHGVGLARRRMRRSAESGEAVLVTAPGRS